MSENNSLCLLGSFHLPDPMPDTDTSSTANTPSTPPEKASEAPTPNGDATAAMPPPSPSPTGEKSAKAGAEMDLTKMMLDTSSFLRTASAQRPSVRYPSRASVSNSAFISAHDYDDLRARLSQVKRELLKLTNVQKDLDMANFELKRTQDEMTLLR